MSSRFIAVMLALTGLLVACGTVAEPRPTFEATHTALPRAANLPDEAEEEPSEIEVALEPTALPTEEPTALPTEEPTALPTEEPTALPTEAVVTEEAAPEVVVNGFVGNADDGDFWFNGGVTVTYQTVERTCVSCHSVEEPVVGSGPYLYGIGKAAAEHAPEGVSAIDYLAESILNPSAVIAPAQTNAEGVTVNWEDGIMPNNWNTVLDGQQVADIVAYLLTLDQTDAHDDHQH